jgi:hypothetical protein
MSQEASTWLNTRTLIGFTDRRGHAWHYRAGVQFSEPNHYPGAVPIADVQRRLFGWDAVATSGFAEYFDEDGFVRLTDASRQAIVRRTRRARLRAGPLRAWSAVGRSGSGLHRLGLLLRTATRPVSL